MYLSKFQVLNYKSYRDSTEIELKRGFNIITGQNSAGKTALLEALALDFKAVPHLSDATVPFRGAAPDGNSLVQLTFVISGSELIQVMRSLGGAPFPRPNPNVPMRSGSQYEGSEHGMNRTLEELVQQPELEVSVQLRRNVSQGGDFWTSGGGGRLLRLLSTGTALPEREPTGI
jgi:DNA repair exonuclease SbcCD ATPase subunit